MGDVCKKHVSCLGSSALRAVFLFILLGLAACAEPEQLDPPDIHRLLKDKIGPAVEIAATKPINNHLVQVELNDPEGDGSTYYYLRYTDRRWRLADPTDMRERLRLL